VRFSLRSSRYLAIVSMTRSHTMCSLSTVDSHCRSKLQDEINRCSCLFSFYFFHMSMIKDVNDIRDVSKSLPLSNVSRTTPRRRRRRRHRRHWFILHVDIDPNMKRTNTPSAIDFGSRRMESNSQTLLFISLSLSLSLCQLVFLRSFDSVRVVLDSVSSISSTCPLLLPASLKISIPAIT
jgi:hypothetical protein